MVSELKDPDDRAEEMRQEMDVPRELDDIKSDRLQLIEALHRLNASLADVAFQRFLIEQALGKLQEELDAALATMEERENAK